MFKDCLSSTNLSFGFVSMCLSLHLSELTLMVHALPLCCYPMFSMRKERLLSSSRIRWKLGKLPALSFGPSSLPCSLLLSILSHRKKNTQCGCTVASNLFTFLTQSLLQRSHLSSHFSLPIARDQFCCQPHHIDEICANIFLE